jgi:GPI mannosyltransferase 4
MTISGLVFICLAIAADTAFYRRPSPTHSFSTLYKALLTSPVITPWNNIRYNSQTSNLALHGLHPLYQHFLANLPQLLGPALILLVKSLQPFPPYRTLPDCSNPRFLSAITGTAILSIFPHQEPRFLLPCVPLLLTCVRLPASPRGRKCFWTSWLIFNILLGTLMGIYHQGGIIPAQLQVPAQITSLTASSTSSTSLTQPNTRTTSATIFWWKTYPPPTYLLGTTLAGTTTISTIPLLGLPQPAMLSTLSSALTSICHSPSPPPPPRAPISKPEAIPSNKHNNKNSAYPIFLIAPLSSSLFPPHKTSFNITIFETPPNSNTTTTTTNNNTSQAPTATISFTLTYTHHHHINLDDLDIGAEGIWATWRRVVGRRGIAMWRVRRVCEVGEGGGDTVVA